MRFSLICSFIALAGMAASAQSTYDRHVLTAAVGVPTSTVTASSAVIRGAIEEITVGLPTAGATATVSIVSAPEVGPALVLYTNAEFTAASRIVPRLDGDGVLTNIGTHYVVLVGDTVTLTVTPVSATTNVNWKAEIKVSR